MRVTVRSPESDATAVVDIDESSGETTLISGEGGDLELAVWVANDSAGGSPVWGTALEALIRWAADSGNALEYDLPPTPSVPGVVY